MNPSRRDLLKAAALGVASSQVLGTHTTAAKSKSERKARGRKANDPIAAYKAALEKSSRRIESVETFTNGNVSFVRIRTNDGAEGWGQISTFDADISAMIMHRRAASRVLHREYALGRGLVPSCSRSERRRGSHPGRPRLGGRHKPEMARLGRTADKPGLTPDTQGILKTLPRLLKLTAFRSDLNVTTVLTTG
ncbi:MAG TPA: hypothetical protein VJJ98_13440 [Sedimentisphaerales bacterium]|nr:hypothetical protein [Sedimentisphaerales bacterium]